MEKEDTASRPMSDMVTMLLAGFMMLLMLGLFAMGFYIVQHAARASIVSFKMQMPEVGVVFLVLAIACVAVMTIGTLYMVLVSIGLVLNQVNKRWYRLYRLWALRRRGRLFGSVREVYRSRA